MCVCVCVLYARFCSVDNNLMRIFKYDLDFTSGLRLLPALHGLADAAKFIIIRARNMNSKLFTRGKIKEACRGFVFIHIAITRQSLNVQSLADR